MGEETVELLAGAVDRVADELRFLGNGNADSEGWGAIEKHGHALREEAHLIAGSLDRLADAAEAIGRGIFELARAVGGQVEEE